MIYNKRGHYICNGIVYQNKNSIKDQTNARFWFFDEIYSSIDWKIEPEASLDKLYEQRAKQLREQYDYLILMYSGGSDSHQVLKSFIKNNIFLNEVRSCFQSSLADKYEINNNPLDPFGLLNEYNSIKKWYQYISKVSPKTKIVIYDYTEDLKQINLDHFVTDYYTKIATHTSLIYTQMRIYLEVKKLIADTSNISKKVGVIYGSDKPFYSIQNNNMYGFFTDTGRAGGVSSLDYFDSSAYEINMFFWSPDMPLIPIKQLHMLKKAIEKNNQFKNFVLSQNQYEFRDHDHFKKIIYPDYDETIYQVKKKPVPGENIYEIICPENRLNDFIKEKNSYMKQKLLNFNSHYRSKYGISIPTRKYNLGQIK